MDFKWHNRRDINRLQWWSMATFLHPCFDYIFFFLFVFWSAYIYSDFILFNNAKLIYRREGKKKPFKLEKNKFLSPNCLFSLMYVVLLCYIILSYSFVSPLFFDTNVCLMNTMITRKIYLEKFFLRIGLS